MIEDYGSDYNDAFNDYDIVSEEFEGDSYTPLTLDTKCASENCEYEMVGSNISSKRNPYLMNGAHAYTETQQLSVLEGKVIITPTTIQWGQDYVTIGEDGESLDYSDGFKTKLDKIGINIKDLLKFKISVIDDNGIKNYEFNAFDVINLLENPCKR